MSREVIAQRPPAVPLDGFPTYRLTAGETVHRAHTAAHGPWWFGSETPAGGGRFDLPAPRGTCYLADSALVAVRERLGIVLGGMPVVAASLLEDVVVSALHLPGDRDLADVEAGRATGFGVTRELETMVPYATPRAWARGFDAAGIGGVAYGPRFSTGDARSYAVFGPAGETDWATDPTPTRARDVDGVPVAIDPPRKWDLTVVRPPRTRARG